MYGILKGSTNTGIDSELQCIFTAPLSVISNQPAYAQDMMNLKRRVGGQNIQRWEIEANIMPSNNDSNFLVHSVLNGYSEEFYIRMPQVYGNKHSTSIYIEVDAAAQTGQKYISGIDALNIRNASNLWVGEFIKFENHSKVYLVVNGGVNGVGIRISPPLQKDVINTEKLVTGDRVTFKAYYDPSVKLGITYIDGIMSNPGSIKFLESI